MRALFLTVLPATLLLAAGETPVNLVAKVGGRAYPAAGPGECKTSSESTIYEVPATQWQGTFHGSENASLQSVNVTVWQPKAGGPDQVTLWLTADGKDHRISTVAGGEISGKATASVRRQGSGGTLLVDGATADGTPVRLEFICEEFSEIVEGNG